MAKATGMMDRNFEAALAAKIDGKTKPLGALGRMEALAAQVARVKGTLTPRMQSCALTIFAADHGIARSGVSAYPAEVTRQMVLNFATGGAAANVFCAVAGVDLRVVNAGVLGGPFDLPGVLDHPIAEGTADFRAGPAMSTAQRDTALGIGCELGQDGAVDAVAFGEMGIGNTSSATLIAHKLTGRDIDDLTGRGTGLDDEGLRRKQALLREAAARCPALRDPAEVLAEYGGFEIAMIAGAMQGAADAGRLVLVDGFIAGAAALIAVRMTPEARGAMVFAHRSAEPGHDAILEALDAEPLLDLNLRLGEGTGAVLVWPVVKSAAAMLNDMASFESAGVSGKA
ncbi:nicotinate-nucleotide--dimethylbenzimidazole phosphoribosyltransferase [Marivita sp. GX14005]|uniref:nicotinate-nucleotide--dimethylbenzimidazole phosphoribosyltransferase n=1 Tax=Marivita sp. GX14005 TaxID=2942276 RepID=UPI00201854B8|nr:nicotinate-nucleotide--dimethylbenzimidazole phosphoribosyltransferase [Marivita sp. GX14005]MCL3883409.1 nicotinate-nucleotide--dimethylbenzimidazole phosphoribosyltransferase [Marivita sp. GX14005]